MYKLLLLFSIIFSANTCKKSQPTIDQETKTVYIGSTLVDCMGMGPQKCMLYKENSEEEWTFFYDTITGFEYEEGYLYTLTIQITKIAEPLADASSLNYTLIRIVKKEKDSDFIKQNTTENTKINGFTYEETTRGYQKKITITPEQITLFKNREEKAIASKNVKSTNWNALTKLCHIFALADVPTWEAPTQKRHRDAAAHATLTIKTEDSTYVSTSFDAGTPPAKLEALTDHILELAKKIDKE